MLRKALVTAILGTAILVLPLANRAQSEEQPSKGLDKISNSVNRFGQDVNQLGKDIFGFVMPSETKTKQAAETQEIYKQQNQGRAGSVFSRYRSPLRNNSSNSDSDKEAATSSQAQPILSPASNNETTLIRSEEQLPDQWPYGASGQSDAKSSESQPKAETLVAIPLASSQNETSPKTSDDSNTNQDVLAGIPLHERLRILRNSPFSKSCTTTPKSSPAKTQKRPALQVEPTEAAPIEPADTIQESGITSGPALKQPTAKSKASQSRSMDRSGYFPRSHKAVTEPSPINKPPQTEPLSQTQNTGSFGSKRHIALGVQQQASPIADQVLIRRNCPVLNVQTTGPAKINIGREAKYRVRVENEAEVDAHDVMITVELPEWADVVGTKTDKGTAAIDRSAASRRLCWRMETLPGKTDREMNLRLIPRERRPIELAVRSSFTQVASQAVIEVQEPQLSMRLLGPKQVKLGKAELFQLEILNSGNGIAEDMVLTLLPLTKSGLPTTHKLGDLAADAKRVIDLELTAQQLEDISVEANLRCNASKGTKLIEKLVVLAPQVKAGVYGPAVRFLGTRGVYQIKVTNFGNFEAKNLQVKAVVPQEAQFIKGTEGVRFEKHSNTAIWTIDTLRPGKEKTLELQCEMINQGTARFIVNIEDGKYTELSKVAAIRIEAMADLTMEIIDPPGPVSIGEEASYEIHIRNRGTRPAESINAIAYFSEGVEPVSASGRKHRITPGQVSFQTIGSIPPNEVVVLKVRAVAERSGNHMFRAETECVSLGTKLIGEETTHFYHGAKLADDNDLSSPNAGNQPPHTADYRGQPTRAPQQPQAFQR